MAFNLETFIGINNKIILFVNQLSIVLLILFGGFIIGKLAEKLALLLIKNSSFKRIKIFSLDFNVEKVIPKIISYIIYAAAIFFSISYAGLLSIVMWAIIIIFVIAVIYSFFSTAKEIFPNIIAGIRIKRNPNFKIRKKIEIGGVNGEIAQINFSEVRVTTEQGDEIHIPCRLFLHKKYVIKK